MEKVLCRFWASSYQHKTMNKRASDAVQNEVCLSLVGISASIFPSFVQAAKCASVRGNNDIYINSQPINECTGLIILEPTEWVSASIWQFPSNEEIGNAWAAGFLIPMSLFLFAWGVGRIVHFFGKR